LRKAIVATADRLEQGVAVKPVTHLAFTTAMRRADMTVSRPAVLAESTYSEGAVFLAWFCLRVAGSGSRDLPLAPVMGAG
jgi:hypothetical protein